MKHEIKFQFEEWKVGNNGNCVVTDKIYGLSERTGHGDLDCIRYYGGELIAESILRKKDVHLISAANDMLEALLDIENDDGQIPKAIWQKRNKAISKAFGVEDWTKTAIKIKF